MKVYFIVSETENVLTGVKTTENFLVQRHPIEWLINARETDKRIERYKHSRRNILFWQELNMDEKKFDFLRKEINAY